MGLFMSQNIIAPGQSHCRVDSLWVFKIQLMYNKIYADIQGKLKTVC